jgi:hypothetical protein
MHYADFAVLAKPTVGNFCSCPKGRLPAMGKGLD